jgi:hypothetical protein
MRIVPKLLRIAALGLALGCAAQAANILVYQDYLKGTSAVPGALTLWGGCGTCTTAADAGAFETDLAAGGWSVVIYAQQDDFDDPAIDTALTTYVDGGGKLIAQTWVTGGAIASLMQASYESQNGTSITTTGDPIFDGLGSTVSLANPGWNEFYSIGWEPTGDATGLGTLSSGGYAAILGDSGDTILNSALTDTYSPTSAGSQLLANEIGYLLSTPGPSPSAVPEPSTFACLGLGVLALAAGRKFRRA